MVVPDQISTAAGHGEVAPIEAWLNEGNDLNDRDVHGDTMLLACATTPHTRTASHTDLVRLLIKQGADVNLLSSDSTRVDGVQKNIAPAKPRRARPGPGAPGDLKGDEIHRPPGRQRHRLEHPLVLARD